MPRKRWIKLWVQELLYGSTVSELEPVERWVWIGLLALAGDSVEPGTIVAAPGIAWTTQQLAQLLAVPIETLESAMSKMQAHDKININGAGIIRIVNWEKYQTDWNRISKYPSQHPTTIPTTFPTEKPTGITDQTRPEEKTKRTTSKSSWKEDKTNFQKFWDAYPRKRSRGQAEKAFERAFKKATSSGVLPGDFLILVLSAVEAARQSSDWQKDGGTFIPYPATWLNAKGWEDEISVQQEVSEWNPRG